MVLEKKSSDTYKSDKPPSKKEEPTLHDSEEILQSNEFDEVVSEIENNSKTDNVKSNPESDLINEKIKQISSGKKIDKPKNIPEEKANELVKKRRIFAKKPDEIKKRTGKNPNIEKNENFDEFIDSDSTQLDEKIKEESKKTQESELRSKENKAEDSSSGEKGLLFKKKTKAEKKPEKSIEEPPNPFKYRFRVENRPDSKEDTDAHIIEEKIKSEKPSVEKTDSLDNVELKAQELAKEHLKHKKPVTKPVKENSSESEKVPLNVTDTENEHVFFDEHEDSSFSGWSPNVIDKDRKELSIPETKETNAKTEVMTEPPIGEIDDVELPKEVLSMDSVKLSELGFSENDWEELDFYSLTEPFAYVEVLREKESLEKCYFLVEVELTDDERNTLEFIEETLSNVSIDAEEFENSNDDEYLTSCVDKVLQEYNLEVNKESLNKILYYLSKSSLGLSKLDPLMNDPNIEDISCDGAGVPLFLYHRKFGSLKSNVSFDTEEELSAFIFKLAQKCGKHISIADPILDATMPDGSRIQMTLSDEITARGSTFTIRKFRSDPFSPPDLMEFNTMSSEMIAYMWIAIENGINMLFAGGTASGKTTALNALSLFIPPESKIVSIEETREINLPHSNWIPGVARSGFGSVASERVVGQIDMYDLMKAALRQRPEYILVGEIRGREAYVLFQAMATGHATYSTVHADSAHSLIHRLEGKPINIPRVMLQSLDVVSLHVTTKVKNKRARRCKQIIEIIDIDPTTKEILTNEVFRWDPVEDSFMFSGKSYVLERIRAEKDMSREEMTDEIKSRRRLVELMNKNNVRAFRDVARIVSRYLDNPTNTLSFMEKGASR